MSPLTQSLQQIDYWMQQSDSPHARQIRDGCGGLFCPRAGLSKETIQLYSQVIGFQLSDEVYELYQWHNGTILMGDMANPVYFVSLEKGLEYRSKNNFNYLPLFIGDDTFYVVPEATEGDRTSPISHYNGRISKSSDSSITPWSYDGGFIHESQAPSITNLMQAIAECIEKYDGFSSFKMGSSPGHSFEENRRYYDAALSPIYRKHGVTDDVCGLWR
jgi:hypothetical protein